MRRAALLLALFAGGCGLGPGDEREGGAAVRVTRDFGRQVLAASEVEKVREDQTVMRLLQSERDVKTRYGGGFVQSIDGLEGEGSSGRRDWFYFVNGIEGGEGAADREVAPGDVVQWDYRRWDAAARVPAIVGAYPEPFLHGSEGKRLPVRVECEQGLPVACRRAKERLAADDVPVTGATLGAPFGQDVARVLVARWPAMRRVRAGDLLVDGPQRSGVFARPAGDGRSLELLDETGGAARSVAAPWGLVAATQENDGVVWLVTGDDHGGVEAAVALLDRRTLRDAFAVATGPRGPARVPVEAR